MQEVGRKARESARILATLDGSIRKQVLLQMATQLELIKPQLQKENQKDLKQAENKKLPWPLVKRLKIDDKVFDYMLSRLKKVAQLPDPLNRVLAGHTQPNGLQVQKISVPIGVIGLIYESRPKVTTDAAAVCLKSGNAVILRGGSESLHTNIILTSAMRKALATCQLPVDAVQIIDIPGHKAVKELLTLDQYIDVLIPRGGKELIKQIARGTNIPVIKHYEGICHLYLAPDAEDEIAIAISVNSKCQRVEVCNALETLLVDKKVANRLLPKLYKTFIGEKVELRGCPHTLKILPQIKPATHEDWITEYLAPILSIKIVDGINQAIEHINTYGSGHTDGIVTRSLELAATFVKRVDSASVLVNSSTRLSGGGDYGLGAVVGISTDKIHARGPVGPDDLISYKWVVYGNGHLRV
jgi:glutamate-5-semialdehyde dehydrogenase